jgi:hypothetical protein
MPNFLVENNFYQGTSQACITDLIPPTFAGINFIDIESRGQIRVGWPAATDPTPPVRYEVYIKANNNTNLFNTANIVAITDKLQYDIFTLPDGSFLQNGTTYYVGVRAIDGVNNRDNNTVSLSVISTGILTSIDVYESKANFSVDQNDNFRVIAWCDKNESLAIAPSAVMGPASYTVYDNVGNLVAGMTGTVASPNAAGLYVFSPVSSSLDLLNKHYQVRVSIQVDGENRVNFIEVPAVPRVYEVKGAADFNTSGQLIGSFWVERNGELATTGLGLGSYEVYTQSGVLIPSLSETNITPDANGFYVITPLTPPGSLDVTNAYIVRVIVEVDGHTQITQFVLGNEPEVFENKAVFSINASNQLRATFWATKNNQLLSGSILGTASYQIYDAGGNPVAGLTQSGITADANGYFHITPVSAGPLTDLTHYTAKITISVAGQNRVSTRAFTLLGT